jgi:molecular chaperone GrpE
MEEQTKQRLVDELRDYLDALPETPSDPASGDGNYGAREVDLYSLFTELAGVRGEVQRESRQIKDALGEFRNVFSTLEEANKRLGGELDTRRQSEAAVAANAERALLLELIDLRDRLSQAHALAAGYRPGAVSGFFARRQTAFAEDMAEGLGITLRRLDQALARYAVKPARAVGQPIDPHRMRVASVRADPGQPDGVAVEEVRRGYQRGDEVLRLAEVVANRTQPTE